MAIRACSSEKLKWYSTTGGANAHRRWFSGELGPRKNNFNKFQGRKPRPGEQYLQPELSDGILNRPLNRRKFLWFAFRRIIRLQSRTVFIQFAEPAGYETPGLRSLHLFHLQERRTRFLRSARVTSVNTAPRRRSEFRLVHERRIVVRKTSSVVFSSALEFRGESSNLKISN